MESHKATTSNDQHNKAGQERVICTDDYDFVTLWVIN